MSNLIVLTVVQYLERFCSDTVEPFAVLSFPGIFEMEKVLITIFYSFAYWFAKKKGRASEKLRVVNKNLVPMN